MYVSRKYLLMNQNHGHTNNNNIKQTDKSNNIAVSFKILLCYWKTQQQYNKWTNRDQTLRDCLMKQMIVWAKPNPRTTKTGVHNTLDCHQNYTQCKNKFHTNKYFNRTAYKSKVLKIRHNSARGIRSIQISENVHKCYNLKIKHIQKWILCKRLV